MQVNTAQNTAKEDNLATYGRQNSASYGSGFADMFNTYSQSLSLNSSSSLSDVLTNLAVSADNASELADDNSLARMNVPGRVDDKDRGRGDESADNRDAERGDAASETACDQNAAAFSAYGTDDAAKFMGPAAEMASDTEGADLLKQRNLGAQVRTTADFSQMKGDFRQADGALKDASLTMKSFENADSETLEINTQDLVSRLQALNRQNLQGNEITQSDLNALADKAGVTAVKMTVSGDSLVDSVTEDLETFETIDKSLQFAKDLGAGSETQDLGADDGESGLFAGLKIQNRQQTAEARLERLQNTSYQPTSVKLASENAAQTVMAQAQNTHLGSQAQVADALNTLKQAVGLTTAQSQGLKGVSNAAVSETVSVNNAHAIKADALSVQSQGLGGASANGTQNQGLNGTGLKSGTATLTMSEDLRRNAEELAQKVMSMAARNMKSLNLSLNPEGLGKMRISLSEQGADGVKVNIQASNPLTRELVADSLSSLKQILSENGIESETTMSEYEEDGRQETASDQRQDGDSPDGRQDAEERPSDTLLAGAFAEDSESDEESSSGGEIGENSQNEGNVDFFA